MKKLILAALLLASLVGFSCAKVDSDEIGVRVLNLPFVNHIERTPKLTGYCFYIPKIYDFYLLPRTYQTLNMIETGQIQLQQTGISPELSVKGADAQNAAPGQMGKVEQDIWQKGQVQIAVHDRRAGNQSVRIKTADGNDAWVNVVVLYHIDPNLAWLVVQKVGLDTDRIASIIGVMVRGSLRAWLGELTSDELLRAETRKLQVEGGVDSDGVRHSGAMQELNARLQEFGIEIVSVTAPSVTVHPDYAAVIKRKQVAEEDRYTYLSYQAHAKQEKETKINRARGEADAQIELARGRLKSTMQQADAEFESRRLTAEGDRIAFNEIGAGISAMASQLGGPGGSSQVALAVAESLKGKRIFILPSQGAINTLDLNSFIEYFAASQIRKDPAGTPKAIVPADLVPANGKTAAPPASNGKTNGANGNGMAAPAQSAPAQSAPRQK